LVAWPRDRPASEETNVERAYNYEAYDYTADGEAVQRWTGTAPGVGEPAPDFELPSLEGEAVSLSSLRGRPVVLEFGSFTCPMFCGHLRRWRRSLGATPRRPSW
jgi:cytochrome oxidase Cu insertion factor (SCO1/SenC/PrrC family)